MRPWEVELENWWKIDRMGMPVGEGYRDYMPGVHAQFALVPPM